MAQKRTSISKITKPRISKTYARQRLFRALDSARMNPVVWISGPAGSGKTTLIASYLDSQNLPCLWYQLDAGDSDIATFFYYMGLAGKKAASKRRKPLPLLTPEYMQDIPTFSKRYFENLFSRLKAPFSVVLDNYQEVALDSIFQEIITEAFNTVPEGIRIFVASREDPPPPLVHLQSTQTMEIIGWTDLRFTLEETIVVIKIHRKGGLSKNESEQLHKMTKGWVAGLVLILQRSRIECIDPGLLEIEATTNVLDYFSHEVFNKIDKDSQDFLMKTAFLSKMTPRMAQDLSGIKNGDQLLSILSRRNIFIEKRYQPKVVYQYHPLFRDFLLRSSKDTYSQEQITDIKKRAGRQLEESGEIEDAVELYTQLGDWERLTVIIIKEAQAMIVQGRNQTLASWISTIPKEILESTPWLLFWMGASKLPFNQTESQQYFERAFHKFRKIEDLPGIFLAWAGISDCITWSFENFTLHDRWFQILRELMGEHKVFPSKEIEVRVSGSMFNALALRRPQDPEIMDWADRALSGTDDSSSLNSKIKTSLMLMHYHAHMGNMDAMMGIAHLIGQLAASKDMTPFSLISARLAEGMYHLFSCSFKECFDAITEALDISQSFGVHALDNMILGIQAMCALSENDKKTVLATVSRTLDLMASSIIHSGQYERSFYHVLRFSEALVKGELREASKHVDLALEILSTVGSPFNEGGAWLAKAQIMHLMEVHREAYASLAKALHIAHNTKSQALHFQALLTMAQFSLDQGKEESSLIFLRRALKIGKENRIFVSYFDSPDTTARLCIKALEADIETDYVKDLIKKRKLVPDAPPLHLENWPWPVKIYALGRFGVIIDGNPLRFTGKAQQKPLELLKVLIGLGGREVQEEALSDVIWPNADGDMAHQSYKTTLRRLRKLIGHPEAIIQSEQKVTLNQQYCWTDVWAFEHLIGEIDEAWENGPEKNVMGQAVELLEKAIELYKGPFLSFEKFSSWSISMRERLRNKFVRSVLKLGKYDEETGQLREALLLYRKSMEVDNLLETFYERLMFCYQRLGQKSMALSVYQQCKDVFASSLGVGPSKEIEKIREAILSHEEIST